MKLSKNYFDDLLVTGTPNEDDRRLVFSGLPVFLILSFAVFVSYSQIRRFSFFTMPQLAAISDQKKDEKIFPVLVEQDYRPKPETEQYRALSDVSAEGKGFLTLNPGFHTLTPYDRLDLGGGRTGTTGANSASQTEPGPGPGEQGNKSSALQGNAGTDAQFRIPQNYRFRQDFAMRYDGATQLSIARQELAGFKYFQRMLRQIQDSFSAPGLNYAYRDQAGLVISEPISPQTVQVLFLLDPMGNVRDVRKVSSLGQKPVDDACVTVLAGQNFGPPPPEVLAHGNIFGINFIFPSVYDR